MQQEIQRRKGVPGSMNSRPIPACDGANAQPSAVSDLPGSRDNRKTRVLVTGADGFVGRHLVPYLVAQGYSVIAASRAATSLRQSGRDRRSAFGSLADCSTGNRCWTNATPSFILRALPTNTPATISMIASIIARRRRWHGRYRAARQSIWCSFPRSPPSPAPMRIMTSPRMIFRRRTMRMDDRNLPPNRRYARPASRLRSCVPS